MERVPLAAAPSMGPRSFDRGEQPVEPICPAWMVALQWGRGHLTAERPASPQAPEPCRQTFNGAAVI